MTAAVETIVRLVCIVLNPTRGIAPRLIYCGLVVYFHKIAIPKLIPVWHLARIRALKTPFRTGTSAFPGASVSYITPANKTLVIGWVVCHYLRHLLPTTQRNHL